MTTSDDGSNIAKAKRKRGRPPGLKNTPKIPVATRTPVAATLHTHVLEIPAGGDVAETIAAFALGCRTFGVCVLSASGPIAAAVLWDASPYSSTLTFQGCFDLLSMTATFLPGGSEGSLAVTLAGPQGQVVGGMVAGPVVAAGTVIVVAATFPSPVFHPFDTINNTSTSLLPVIGGVEWWGKSLPAAEKCEIGTKTGQVHGASMLVEGGGADNWEGGLLKNYVEHLEEYLELRPAAEGVFNGVSVVGGDSGGEEVDRIMFEHYLKELEQCLELATAAGGASSGGGVGADKKKDLDSASVPGGSDRGNMFAQYSYLPTVADSAFGSGRDGCGEHFAFDAFRVSGVCRPLY